MEGVLKCKCDAPGGQEIESSVVIESCPKIANMNGKLVCDKVRGILGWYTM